MNESSHEKIFAIECIVKKLRVDAIVLNNEQTHATIGSQIVNHGLPFSVLQLIRKAGSTCQKVYAGLKAGD